MLLPNTFSKVEDLGRDATPTTPRSQNAHRAQQRGRALLRGRGGRVHVNLRGNLHGAGCCVYIKAKLQHHKIGSD